MTDIPWDREAELFQAKGRQAEQRITRTKMTLGEALDAFLALPEDEQIAAGISLRPPLQKECDGKTYGIGWFNAKSCHELARHLPSR